jgi:N-acetylneuraminic acid mutarotase
MNYFLPIFMLFMVTSSFGQDIWEQRDSVNGPPRAVCASFVLNGEGYVLGGLDDFGFRRKVYSYDPSNNDWDDEESIGGPDGDGLERGNASSFSIDGKGYLCLGQGQTNPYFRDTWEFDPVSQSWTQKADFMGTARKQAVAFSIGMFGYVGTGQDVNGLCKDFYRFDPESNTWTQLNDFPGTARRQAVAFAMGDEAYLGTGDDGVMRNDFWMYVPETDTWIQKADFPGTPRAGATGWGIFPTGFIATGEDINFSYKKDVWEYNYFSNTWIQRADFPGNGRKNAISFVINGIAYLGTGFSGVFEDDFYAYTGIVGINEKPSVAINIYPNPSADFLNISMDNEWLSAYDLSVSDAFGKECTQQCKMQVFSGKIRLNLQNLNAGTYIYRLNTQNGSSIVGKFIVQK